MLRRALHHRRKDPEDNAKPPASPSLAAAALDEHLPKVSDRKAILGCLAAVLASMYAREFDDGDEEHFFKAYDAHCTVHTEYETKSSGVGAGGGGGSSGGADTGGTAKNDGDGDDDDGESADEFNLNDIFGNRAKLRIAVSRHKRRKYEVKMDLLRWSTRLLMLDEADATALIPMLKPLLCMGDDNHGDDFRVDEILRPFLSSLSSGRAAFECITLLLFNYLLLSSGMSSEEFGSSSGGSRYSGHEDFVGYDARIRHAFKRLAMAVFSHCMMKDYSENIGQVAEQLKIKLSSESEGSSESIEDRDADDSNGVSAEVDASCRPTKDELGKEIEISVRNDETLENSQDKDAELMHSPLCTRVSDVEAAATHKFEALEHTITVKLLALSEATGQQVAATSGTHKRNGSGQLVAWERKQLTWQKGLQRAAKVCSAGVLAGAVFGLTGGLAAPGIAATVAMLAGSAAATGAVVVLTSTVTVATLFGVTGGVLCAAKMTNRVLGLKEFSFKRECHEGDTRVELSRTVCVSGWLRDMNDFRRPWGVVPGTETSTQEKLERFYSVHFPDKVARCEQTAEEWKGKEDELWEILRDTYGQDPDSLLPFKGGPREAASLCSAENDAVNSIMEALGYSASTNDASKQHAVPREDEDFEVEKEEKEDIVNLPAASDNSSERQTSSESFLRLPTITQEPERPERQILSDDSDEKESDWPAHLTTFWDYHSKYGGELYTVRWESELLWKLTSSVARISGEFASSATLSVLNETALNALSAGLTLPSNLLRTLKVIDGPWALACKRADQIGKILARSLLESDAGHRPVTLVGFSLGARIVNSCLKELALHQERWELQREQWKKNKTKPQDAVTQSASKATVWGSQMIDEKESAGRYVDDSVTVDGTAQAESGAADAASIEGTSTEGKAAEAAEASSPQIEEITYLREPASIVEDAILIGCPVYVDLPTWAAFRRVVAGRLVNCFLPRDMVLLLIFQYECVSGLLRPTNGTHEINLPGVENFNVSELVSSHGDYCFAMDPILSLIRHGQPERLLNPQYYIKGHADESPDGDDEVSAGPDGFSNDCDDDEESLPDESLDEDDVAEETPGGDENVSSEKRPEGCENLKQKEECGDDEEASPSDIEAGNPDGDEKPPP